MLGKKELREAFGYPFTSKKAVREAMGYSQATEIRRFFYGLAHVGQRYFTDDVIDRIFDNIEYDEDEQEIY